MPAEFKSVPATSGRVRTYPAKGPGSKRKSLRYLLLPKVNIAEI